MYIDASLTVSSLDQLDYDTYSCSYEDSSILAYMASARPKSCMHRSI